MDDRETWSQAAEGSAVAREALALRVQELARGVLANMSARAEEREDLVQEVHLSVFSYLERGLGPPQHLPGLVYYRCLSAHRLYRLRGARERGPEVELDLPSAPANPGEHWKLLDMKELATALKGCWGELGVDLRLVLRRRYLEGAQHKDLTVLLSVSEVTVRHRIRRAIELLRACLRGKGFLS